MIVYKATNINNGKIYIGKTVRALSHAKARHHQRALYLTKYGCQSRLYTAIRKYGMDAFEWEVIYKGCSDQDIQEKERFYIVEFDSMNPAKGYNMTPGGDGGAGNKLSDAHKTKLSLAFSGEGNTCYGLYGDKHPAYGNRHTEECKQRIRESHLGKSKSVEHRNKLSAARKEMSRFTADDYLKMIEMRNGGLTYRAIGAAFNCNPSVAFKICKRETDK
jgi:group I intron endonuclease